MVKLVRNRNGFPVISIPVDESVPAVVRIDGEWFIPNENSRMNPKRWFCEPCTDEWAANFPHAKVILS